MNPVARSAPRSVPAKSRVRAAAAAMVELLELRRLFAYNVIEVVDAAPEPGTNYGAGIASNGNLALVPNALGANFDGKVTLIDTTDGSVVRVFDSPAPGGTFGSGVAWVGSKIAIGASALDRIYVYDNAADLEPDVIGNPTGAFASGFGVAMTAYEGDLLASNTNGDGEVLRFDLDLLDGDPDTLEEPQDLLIATYSYDNTALEPDLTQLGTAIVTHNGKIYAAAKDQTSVGYVVEFDVLGDADAGTYTRLIDDPAVTPAQGSVPFGSDLAIAGNNLLVGAKDANALYEINLTTLASVPYEVQGTDAGLGLGIAVNGSQVALGNLAFSGASVLIYDWATRTHIETINNPPETGTATNENDNFGMFINALPDGGWLVADNSDDLDADNWDTGAVYIFTPDGAPMNTPPSAAAIDGPDNDVVRNQAVSFTGSFADPDVGDSHTINWDFGDGNTLTDAGLQVSHVYTATGTYTVEMTVTDEAGDFDTAMFAVTVSTSGVIDGTLYIVPNDGTNDTVVVKKNDTGGSVVTFNGVALPLYGGSQIVVYGGTGDDTISVSPAAGVAIEAYGGDGNDSIAGGSGNDILVGGDGNDVLYGGAGLDLIIGGHGGDGVYGEVSDDILIAPSTTHDNDSAALNAIMAIWTNGASFADRVATLKLGLLTSGDEVKLDVFDGVDTLTGKNGDDWFIYNGDEDIATDVKPGELAFVLTE